mmetsp:Transcript_21097/g.60886  ORF Transcript_21097/g.60886 Transcript_21097/m.60886 type:complete len:254 (-) Transcript_21097:825-1586(-)
MCIHWSQFGMLLVSLSSAHAKIRSTPRSSLRLAYFPAGAYCPAKVAHARGAARPKQLDRCRSERRSLQYTALHLDLFQRRPLAAPAPARTSQRQSEAVLAEHLLHGIVKATDGAVDVHPQEEIGGKTRVLGNGSRVGGEAPEGPHGKVLRVPLSQLAEGTLRLAHERVLCVGAVHAVVPHPDLLDPPPEEHVRGLAGLADIQVAALQRPGRVALHRGSLLPAHVHAEDPRGADAEEIQVGYARHPAALDDEDL